MEGLMLSKLREAEREEYLGELHPSQRSLARGLMLLEMSPRQRGEYLLVLAGRDGRGRDMAEVQMFKQLTAKEKAPSPPHVSPRASCYRTREQLM